jgi:hypothetical protein
VATITTKPKNAYLIVFIAGLILSSFHQESITKTHPRNINNTVVTDANNIRIDIVKSKNSHKSIVFHQKIDVVAPLSAYIESTNIINNLVK